MFLYYNKYIIKYERGDYMLKPEISALINDQINKELFSAYLYLHMANYYTFENLSGFANWFNVQVQEELAHVRFFIQYLQDNGEPVSLKTIDADTTEFQNFLEPLQLALEHERLVTESIENIYAHALEKKDFRTTQFLDWFIKEQGEEEKNAEDLVKKFELFAADGKGLYLLDTELAARTFVQPTLVI